jgi:peptide/nickel transport system substrate-binding protein
MPTVSSDGRTWTIHIRPGIHYGPPLQDQELVAGDFVTALKRTAEVTKQDGGDYAGYYGIIEGFSDYQEGKADTISGVSTPDPHTLVFTLTQRSGDLPDRLALPATSPIPSLPASGRFGIATGHDTGFGRYQVATGPYMFEKSESLTPGAPAKEQKPASGASPSAGVIRLVRNPSWQPSTDEVRPAYADRIEIKLLSETDVKAMQARLDRGSSDVVMYGGPPADVPLEQEKRYQANPSLGRVIVSLRDSVRYAVLNLAMPPFDDVHVRRAANYIVDKTGYIRALGGPTVAQPATHIALDSLEGNQLQNYDPFKSSSPDDALAKAKAEMRLSRYDSNHDGLCDARACEAIQALVGPGGEVKAPRRLAADLAKIGVDLDLQPREGFDFFSPLFDPSQHVPIAIGTGWVKDFINASQYITPLFGTPRLNDSLRLTLQGIPPESFNNNYGLVGARPEQLRGWGYKITRVPGVDDRIKNCAELVGQPQTQCWTALDQYLTESVVPWIPLLLESNINVIPARVVNFSLTQLTNMPALDQIVVRASTPTPSPS